MIELKSCCSIAFDSPKTQVILKTNKIGKSKSKTSVIFDESSINIQLPKYKEGYVREIKVKDLSHFGIIPAVSNFIIQDNSETFLIPVYALKSTAIGVDIPVAICEYKPVSFKAKLKWLFNV